MIMVMGRYMCLYTLACMFVYTCVNRLSRCSYSLPAHYVCRCVCVREWCVLVCSLNTLDPTTHQHAPFTHAQPDTDNTPIQLHTNTHHSHTHNPTQTVHQSNYTPTRTIHTRTTRHRQYTNPTTYRESRLCSCSTCACGSPSICAHIYV